MRWLDEVQLAKLSPDERFSYEQSLKHYRDNLACLDAAKQEGIEQGIDIGDERGIEQGKKQGIEQGTRQGIEQGKKQGIEQGIARVARNMPKQGLPVEIISKRT